MAYQGFQIFFVSLILCSKLDPLFSYQKQITRTSTSIWAGAKQKQIYCAPTAPLCRKLRHTGSIRNQEVSTTLRRSVRSGGLSAKTLEHFLLGSFSMPCPIAHLPHSPFFSPFFPSKDTHRPLKAPHTSVPFLPLLHSPYARPFLALF